MGVVVAALHLAERPAQLAQWVRDGHRDQQGAREPDHQRRDGQQQDGRGESVGAGGEDPEFAAHQREHNRQYRHAGGEHPGENLAQDDTCCVIVLRHAAAQGRNGDRPKDALRLQIADDRGGGGAQCGGDGNHRCGLTGHRPAGDDEHHRPQQPVDSADQRAVEGHFEPPHPGLFGFRRVMITEQQVASLPAHDRDEHAQ